MRAADDAVTIKQHRDDFEEEWRNGRAKAWIVNHAQKEYGGGSYPSGLTVEVTEGMPTHETAWIVGDDQLHLDLGWATPTGLAITLDKWPCGMFAGF